MLCWKWPKNSYWVRHVLPLKLDVMSSSYRQNRDSLSILTTTEWTHKTKLQRTSNVINVIPFSDDKNLQKHEDDSGQNSMKKDIFVVKLRQILRSECRSTASNDLWTPVCPFYVENSEIVKISWNSAAKTHLIQDEHSIFSRCRSGDGQGGSRQWDIGQSPFPDTGAVIWNLEGAALVIV